MIRDLNWRSVTPGHAPGFLVKGTVLNVALAGRHSRFLIEEVRSYDSERNADRVYRVRDAHTVSDDDVRIGKRPSVVGRFETLDDALKFCSTFSD